MHKSQANRARIAKRTAPSTPNDVAMLRVHTPSVATGPVRRTRAVSMAGAQRNSEGRRSEWSMSQNNRDGKDPRWSATVSSQY